LRIRSSTELPNSHCILRRWRLHDGPRLVEGGAMTDGLSRKSPGGRTAAVQNGPDGRPRRGRTGYNEENVAANALPEREAEALIRRAVELTLLGTSTFRRDSGADVLQMQPSRIAETNLDCSLEVERMGRDFRLMSTIMAETGATRASGARPASARHRDRTRRLKCGRSLPASGCWQSHRAP